MDHHKILIFTDGACSGNPGPGGWGALMINVERDRVKELGGSESQTTNNRMEMTAALRSLSHLKKGHYVIHVYTDSKYVIQGSTQWLRGWKYSGWKTREGKEVSNQDLWREMDQVLQGLSVEWHYVAGHEGVPGNERVDELAVEFSQGRQPQLYDGSLSAYPYNVLSESGDVLMQSDPVKAAQKASQKQRQKSAAYSYLSLVGQVAMRHSTWSECEQRIRGVPRAKYKKAVSPEDEAEILASWGTPLPPRS